MKGAPGSVLAQDIDLVGGGSVSFKQFVEAKTPTSGPERCLIAVYWLTRLTISPVEAMPERVYTCYKHVAWPVPTDLVNTIQKAGSEGWLNTKSRNDIKVIVGGEKHVEHTIPAQPKKP